MIPLLVLHCNSTNFLSMILKGADTLMGKNSLIYEKNKMSYPSNFYSYVCAKIKI